MGLRNQFIIVGPHIFRGKKYDNWGDFMGSGTWELKDLGPVKLRDPRTLGSDPAYPGGWMSLNPWRISFSAPAAWCFA